HRHLVRAGVFGARAEKEDAAEAEAGARDRRRARVVRLDAAAGEHRVRPFGERVAEEELELADLVAALGAAGRVVALHPKLDAGERVEPARSHERRRGVDEKDAGSHHATGVTPRGLVVQW